MKEKAYYEKVNVKNETLLRNLLQKMPPYCKQFFIGIEPTTSSRTRIAYAYDLNCFFEYLHENNPLCTKKDITEIPLSVLGNLAPMDIEEYLSYLKYYEKDGVEHTNDERGLKRKLASLRSFYRYLYKNEMIGQDPAVKVDMPKIHEKTITRLDIDEVANLLDEVESGESLTEKQQKFHEKTKTRDLAMMTLLLGTGIRVSECVGLDMDDVDFKNNGIKIHRKGGAEVVVYFGEEVRSALMEYMVERQKITAADGSVNALFLSLQNKRISVRSVEKMVNKYSKLVTSLKHITPHKLRSTYGTSLYRETGDIYLVADVLGHKDVNTTRKHYAAIDDDRRRSAAKYVKLREPYNFATSRSFPAIKNLPCLSNSHSVAPDKKNLTKFLAFLLVIGSAFNLSSNFPHSDIENPNKQPSKPVVSINFSPMSSLNLAGIINLPFASRECSYSPINTFIHLANTFSPLCTTFYHFN